MTISSTTLSEKRFQACHEFGKPVILWATPRSVSTAFERVMKESHRFEVIHEPYADAYFFGSDRISDRYGDLKSVTTITTIPEGIEYLIRQKRNNRCTFVKELAFQGEPFVADEILADSCNLMIMRHPRKVYSSLMKLKPDFSEEEFGFTALEKIYNRLDKLDQIPLIIDGDVFQTQPTEVVQIACSYIGIPFCADMLSWDSGRIRDWTHGEMHSQAVWHATLESSNTIIRTNSLPVTVLPEHANYYKRAVAIFERLKRKP